MTRKPKYLFGGQSFSSKDAVRKFAGAMRARYDMGATISANADAAFLRDLLQGHVERETKIGPGISRFFVDSAPDHPGACFWLERSDGSTTDFGVPACLQSIGRVNRMALRMAIRPDLDTFKSAEFAGGGETFVSHFSGKTYPVAEAVADHVTLFEEIVVGFFGSRGINLESRMLTRSVDQKSEPEWNDTVLLDEFLKFHRTCPLRLVHWRENLSELKTNTPPVPT